MEIFCFELENKKKIPAGKSDVYTRTLQTNLPFVFDYTIYVKKMRIFCCFFFSTKCCIRIMCRSIVSLQLLSEAEYDLNYAYRGLEGVRSRRRIFAYFITQKPNPINVLLFIHSEISKVFPT